MTATRIARLAAVISVLLALTAYAVADRDPIVFLIGVPASIVACIVTGGTPPRIVPRSIINLLLFVVVAWATLSLFSEGLGVSLFSEFVAALIVVKMLDRRGHRDAAQVLTLSVFLVIGAILTSNAFWIGLVLVFYLPVIISAVLWHQLARVEELAGVPLPPVSPLRGTIRIRTAVISAGALLIASAIFLLMPRELGSRALGAWGAAAVGRVVGFNDEVRLGTGGLISDSREPVLDLQLFDRSGDSVGAVGRRFYLRGAVLDTYDQRAGAWVRSENARNNFQTGPPAFIRAGVTPVGGARPADWTIRQEVTIRNVTGERGHLFSIWRTNQVQVDPPARLEFCPADSALRVQSHRGKVSYTVYSNDQVSPPTNWSPPDPERRLAPVLDLPEIREIAAELLIDAAIEPDPLLRPVSDDHRAAAILRNYFNAGGFTYTLDTLSAPPGLDPIVWFLTQNREGHCEYFASALAAMLRSVGIDARVITGYVATDYNEATSGYIVRANNAHAWVEAETLPGDWRILDPTPPAELTRIHEPPTGLLADFRRFLDTLEFAWIRTVVGYDADRRAELLGAPDAETSVFPLLDRMGESFERVRFAGPRLLLEAARNALIAFVLILGAGLLFFRGKDRIGLLLIELLRRIAGLFIPRLSPRPRTPESILLRDLLGVFERAGRSKPSWTPLRTHTEQLARSGDLAGPDLEPAQRLCELLYRALFAGRPITEPELHRARSDLTALRRWSVSAARTNPTSTTARPADSARIQRNPVDQPQSAAQSAAPSADGR